MATKVGDIYVDLGVHIEDTSKAVKSLQKAFGALAKSAISLRPRIDRAAMAEIGKQGSVLSKSLSQSFEKAAQGRIWKNLADVATGSLQKMEKESEALDKKVRDVYRSTATGAKYWKSYLEAANPQQATARLQAFENALNKSKAAAVVAAKEEAAAAARNLAGYQRLSSTAGAAYREIIANSNGATRAIMSMPAPIARVASSLNNVLGGAFNRLAKTADDSMARAGGSIDSLKGHAQKAFGFFRFQAYTAVLAVERVFRDLAMDAVHASASIAYTSATIAQVNENALRAAKGYDKMTDAQKRAFDAKYGEKIAKQAEAMADRMNKAFIQFSQTTPYTIDQIQAVGQQLNIAKEGMKANGLEGFNLIKVMRSIGDIAAATGRGVEGMQSAAYVLQQIGQSGQVASDDFRQLHNSIPNFREIIAKQLHVPLKEVDNDLVRTPEAIQALFSALEKGGPAIGTFGGALEAMNQTVPGQFARMKETIINGIAQIINAMAPVLIPAFSAVANAAQRMTNRVIPAMQQMAPKIAATFKQIQSSAQSSGLSDLFGDVLSGAGDVLTRLAGQVQTFAQNFSKGFSGAGGAAAFSGVLEQLRATFEKLWPIMQNTGKQISAVLGPAFTKIGQMIGGQLLPAIQRFLPAITPIAGFLLKIFGSALVGAIKGVVNVVQGVITVITGILNVFTGLLTGNWSLAWQGLKGIVQGALQAVWGIVQFMLNVGILNLFKTGLLKLLPAILRGGMKVAIALFRGMMGGIGAAVRGLPGLLRAIASEALGLFLRSAQAGGSRVVGFFRGLPSAIGGVLRALGSFLFGIAKGALGQMVRALVPGPVRQAMSTIASRAIGALRSGLSKIGDIGRDIVSGIARGIDAAWSYVSGAISRLTSKIPGWAKKLLGIGSPSRVMAKEVGKWIPAGIAVGIDDNYKTVSQAMTNLAIKVGKAGEKAATKIVKKFTAKMTAMAKRMDILNASLGDAQDNLQRLTDMRDSYIEVFKGWTDLGSMGLSTDAEGNEVFSFSQALSDLTAAKKVANDIADLGNQAIGKGLDKNSLDAILQMGPEKAKQWLQGIVAGGSTVADQVDSYFAAFTVAGSRLGDSVVRTFENSSVAAAQAFVTSLQSQQASLMAQFAAMGKAAANQIIAALNSTKGGINVGYGPGKKKNKKTPHKAIGTMSWRGGQVWAGENGPELLDLPPRTRIHTAHASERMADNGPVELSEDSIRLLAQAILEGAVMVSSGATRQALNSLAVRA